VIRSVLSNDVYIGPHAIVEDSVLLQGVRVGSGARVRKAIIDQDVAVPNGFSIGYDAENDKKFFSISPGKVVVVPRGISLGRGAKG
jgi:glucose-1-phosphate adenylyltransferase